jgi:hypothetical protein
MPIAFEELEGSPTIRITQEGVVGRRSFRVGWSDWAALARELIGTYKVVGGSFTFLAPLEFPGQPNLMVSELEVAPFEPSSPDAQALSSLVSATNSYTAGGARVTATYRTAFDRNNQPRPDLPEVRIGTYLTYGAEIGAEYLSTPGRIWHWDDPPANPSVADDVQPGLLIPQGVFQLTWHRVALPPWSSIRQLRGKVNSNTFVGAPPGTVLFMGARVRRQFQFVPDGGFWTIEYTFHECTKELSTGVKVGWNYFYKETKVGTEHWVQIKDADGNLPYAAADFGPLFQFGS